jgi:hypothetical protein
MARELSLAVVGADFPNRRGPGRRFEIRICKPGEDVVLVPEPNNPADPNAIAVMSSRNIQIGYITAERCQFVRTLLAREPAMKAVFQNETGYGAVIRANLDGAAPTLPEQRASPELDDWTAEYFVDESRNWE